MGEIRKFTSEDLMKAMGLSVGDRVRVNDEQLMTVVLNDCGEIKLIEDYIKIIFPIEHLLNKNIEIIPRPKRVGDLKCDGKCSKDCPVRTICIVENCTELGVGNTFYEFLETYHNLCDNAFDQEIYDLLKARLDKEVE